MKLGWDSVLGGPEGPLTGGIWGSTGLAWLAEVAWERGSNRFGLPGLAQGGMGLATPKPSIANGARLLSSSTQNARKRTVGCTCGPKRARSRCPAAWRYEARVWRVASLSCIRTSYFCVAKTSVSDVCQTEFIEPCACGPGLLRTHGAVVGVRLLSLGGVVPWFSPGSPKASL